MNIQTARLKTKTISLFVLFSILFTLAQVLHSSPSHASGAQTVCFDGTSSSNLTRPSGVTGFPTTTAYTIEAWVKMNSIGIKEGIAGWGDGASNRSNAFDLSGSANSGTLYNWWYGNDLKSTLTTTTGSWHHVAAEWDGTTRSLYLDGVQISSAAATGLNASNTSTFKVGGYYNEYFHGCMNNLRIVKKAVYSGAFTPQADLQSTQSAGTNIAAIGATDTVLILNDPTSYLKDGSSYHNDLTGNGTLTVGTDVPVSKSSQTISFSTLPSTNIYAGNITLGTTSGYSAASTSGTGATITYSSASSSSICTVTAAGVITVKAVGTCAVSADAAATTTYGVAATVTQNLVIANTVPSAPTINSVAGGDASATIVFTPGRNGGAAITTETITATNTSSNTTSTAVITSGTTLVAGSATFPGSDTALTTPFGQVRYKMTGLANGQTYTFAVTAANSVGTSAASTASLAVTPISAPNAVSGLVATAGNGQVVLSWVSPGAAGLGGGTFVSYTIYKKLHSAGSYSGTADITDTASVNDTSATITGLTNGTAYDFKVLINATGGSAQASDYTAYANLIPAAVPNAPTLTISYASSTTVSVTWVGGNSNGSAITGYTLTYTLNGSSTSCSGGSTTTAAGSSCTLTGVAGDDFGATAYATNLIGNSTSVSASFTLIGTAAAPASLVGTPGDASATIAFTEDANGDPISDYLYSIDGGTTFISSGSNSSPITITGLTNGTPVSIIIQAVGAVNGVSTSSSSVTVTPAAPAAPAASGGGKTISVSTTIDRTTTSSQSPVVQQGIDAISNHKDVDQYFKSPTTTSNQPTGTTISPGNIQTINSTTAVNTQVVTTTSNKQAVVTISLTAPIITDQAVAALSTKITVVSTQTGMTVTPVAGFTGVLVVPVIATVNGVQTTVLNKVVVNPVAPAPQGFAPTDIGKSSVAWTASASQVTAYQVAINGKSVGTTTASNIALPSLIGPKSKVTVTAIGNDQTASTPVVIPYVAKAPIPALKVTFISGSAVLTPAQKADISSIAKVIDTQGFTRLVVNGFTDAVGSPAANAVLSQARAQAVVSYMKTLLPKVAVKAGANGSANPVADNTTALGQAQNRRTEIATW